jgi:SHS family sialic acid transporter-like MFS transporter
MSETKPLVSGKLPSNGELTAAACYIILTAAFLGWMFSGFQMAVMTLCARSATTEFLRRGQLTAQEPLQLSRLWSPPPVHESSPAEILSEAEALQSLVPRWFSWYNAAFLFGAASGGLAFGWLGDRIGRVRAMATSIVCFSLFSGFGYVVASPEQLLALRFLSGMGVGGMWPTGVALAAEAWSDASRPLVAGVLGTAANVGLVIFNTIGYYHPVSPDSWRWTMLICGSPLLLGGLVLVCVPESPRWLAAQTLASSTKGQASVASVFRQPLLGRTLIGIALGTIPLLGGWGATQWLVAWADKVGGVTDPRAKALTAIMRSGGGAVGSLLGGWVASLLGRRLAYFLISVASLAVGEYVCLAMTPADRAFPAMVFAVGFISTIFFGWLPLYLPELFPTHARSTGAGVSFNFGRILTGFGVLATGAITAALHEDYGRAGSIAMLVYAVGMLVILFAPDTTKDKLKD